MSTVVDGRIAERRRRVRESGARRRLRRVLGVGALAGLAAFVGWLFFQSSWLAVSEISVTGQTNSQAEHVVAGAGLAAGIPTISVDEGGLESALMTDPWVAKAHVQVTWPGTVEVTVLEHIPVGWVAMGEQWVLAAPGGDVLAVEAVLPEGAPVVEATATRVQPGDVFEDVLVVGALEFLGRLPAPLAAGAVLSADDGTITGVVSGHPVMLGRPDDMSEKAGALIALLESGIPDGAEVNLTSPSRPATANPQQGVESSLEVGAEAQPSG